ncbi:MAG: exodeoxyribonuclease VII small subunit [Anaerolineae bacterium CG_4_9_14_0_8_um_filter_58_9]|nr:MAG: exodeoxyribonuclease VII small subunit [Anaerolineae bacterium CG_4_9_14_0_8_um_filter_58_9]
MVKSVDPQPVDEMAYEPAFAELEGIVSALESEQRPLEEAMALFERGQALAKRCAGLLDKAEIKVRQLTGEEIEDFVEE